MGHILNIRGEHTYTYINQMNSQTREISFKRKKKNHKPVVPAPDRFEKQPKPATEPKQTVVNHEPDPIYEYVKMFDTELKAEPKKSLKASLIDDPYVYDVEEATQRIQSLSRYLKENMVGFITPGGEHWFERSLEYLIKGAVAEDLEDKDFEKYGKNIAKEFFGLLAKADDYWTSDGFLNYLKGNMDNSLPGVRATVAAVKELRKDNCSNVRNSQVAFGYESDLKYIPELLKRGGAYTATPLNIKKIPNNPYYATLEHILPHSRGGDEVNLDCNYLLTTGESNSKRGNIPLLAFIKGWDQVDYTEKAWGEELRRIKGQSPTIIKQLNDYTANEMKKARNTLDQMRRSSHDRKFLLNISDKIRHAISMLSGQQPPKVSNFKDMHAFFTP